MDIELNERHRQVLELESLRRRRKYKEGWLYHLCKQKGLLKELQELQVAGRVGDAPTGGEVKMDEDGRVPVHEGSPAPRTMLTVELVPRTSWFTNLRSELSKD